MERKLKVGCIGLGPRGCSLFNILMKNPNVEAYAVCDREKEKLEKCKKEMEKNGLYEIKYYEIYEELLASDVEAVIVATHIDTHCEISIAALNAGKHVLCEIPNISSIEEASKLLKAVKANPQQKFMVAENCCYWDFILTWKAMYEDGLLGDVLYAESDYLHMSDYMLHPEKEMTWRSYLSSVRYMTHNLGPLLYILNDTCEEISGFVPDINPIEAKNPAPPNGVAMIKTTKGALIKIFIGFGTYNNDCTHNFTIYGSKGVVENQRYGNYHDTYATLKSIPTAKKNITIPAGNPGGSTNDHGGADPKLLEAFVECIIKDEKPPLDVEYGINIALPGILADMSRKEGGRVIKMPSLEELLTL